MASSNTPAVNEEYFKSYADLEVHALMIKDKPRTDAYRDFIQKNSDLFKGKVVLDVGAGSGILSLFAAQAGAKKVYAIEASSMASVCEEIVKVNKYENVILVYQEMMEEVELPEKVDVIISEWMGFYLLHESMLTSVIVARDKWLKEDGILLPSHAGMYACPVNMTDYCNEKFNYWENVYGFDFSPFLMRSLSAQMQQPAVAHLNENQLLSDRELVARFDLKTMTMSEIEDFEEQIKFTIKKNSDLHGFAVWFDVRFTPDLGTDQYGLTSRELSKSLENGQVDTNTTNSSSTTGMNHITLGTSPTDPETHWKQTVCFLPAALQVNKSDNIFCRLRFSQDESNLRHYNISMEIMEDFSSSSESDLDEEEEEDTESHPVPCDCGASRCTLIRAIMEKYDAEQNELEMEAEFTDVSAEVQAAQAMNDSSCLDMDNSLKDDSTSAEKDES
ncbi:hypothetical protein ACF0H5_022803 [Mactra antiquata]